MMDFHVLENTDISQNPGYARWLCDIPAPGSFKSYSNFVNCPEITISVIAAFLFSIIMMHLK